MANEISANTFGHKVSSLKAGHNKSADGASGQAVSSVAQDKNEIKKPDTLSAKQQLNASILKSNLEVSVSAGNNPMALLYKTAIEGINEALAGELGDNAIQNAYDSGLDVSPEATADRIVSMSTAFYSKYREQHSDMSEEEAVKAFADIISGGIDKGFEDARGILSGLNVLEGDIASNIDSTYDLVQKGLQDFVDSFSKPEEETLSNE